MKKFKNNASKIKNGNLFFKSILLKVGKAGGLLGRLPALDATRLADIKILVGLGIGSRIFPPAYCFRAGV